jgi:hypothetical protein
MAQLITDPKKGKDGQIEYVVNYHHNPSRSQRSHGELKSTLEGEVQVMLQEK